MAYTPFFEDRVVEFPGRIKLTNVANGTSATYDVERVEGSVIAAGTLLNATNLNDGTTREFVQLDTSAQSGTDKELYDALVALGWTDVIV